MRKRLGFWRAPLVALAVAVMLSAQPASVSATVDNLWGQIPQSGGGVDYLVQRCTTWSGGPLIHITQWPRQYWSPPDPRTIHLRIRNGSGAALGPWWAWGYNDANWKNMGYLSSGTCFYISGYEDGDWWRFGQDDWYGQIDY